MVLFRACAFILLLLHVQNGDTNGSKLLIFLLDGFRWDYFDQPNVNLPNFKKLFNNGIRADYTTGDFPSLSLPNYYTIMTGLHTESHGMIGNDMYDEKNNKYFLINDTTTWSDSSWWDGGEPLWVTAEKQGKRAYMYYWRGCNREIRNTKPTFCEPYGKYPNISTLSNSINKGLQLFKTDKADLVAIYTETPDAYGHRYGANSPQLNRKLTEIDVVIGQLQQNLITEGLEDEVVVMIFSDHGMTEISPERIVNLTEYIDVLDLRAKIVYRGPLCSVWPKSDKIDMVYNNLLTAKRVLGHIQVFKKKDIPDKWYYKNSDRVAPITVVADLGWYILNPYYEKYPTDDVGQPFKGYHGYDPTLQDMKGIFVAAGPGIKKKLKAKPIHAVDIYQLMCHVMQITPSSHNGTWSRVAHMLTETSSATSCGYKLFLILFSVWTAVLMAT